MRVFDDEEKNKMYEAARELIEEMDDATTTYESSHRMGYANSRVTTNLNDKIIKTGLYCSAVADEIGSKLKKCLIDPVFGPILNKVPSKVKYGTAAITVGVAMSFAGGAAKLIPTDISEVLNDHIDIDNPFNIPAAYALEINESSGKDVGDIIKNIGLTRQAYAGNSTAVAASLTSLDYVPVPLMPAEETKKLNKRLWRPVQKLEGDLIEITYEKVLEKYRKTDTVIVTRADIGSDALAAIAYAEAVDAPILLIDEGSSLMKTKFILNKLGVKNTIIFGGEEAVSENVEQMLPNVTRIGGKDRYETAVKAAELTMSEAKVSTLVIAYGDDPSILTANAAKALKAPVLYLLRNETGETIIPDTTRNFLHEIPKHNDSKYQHLKKIIGVDLAEDAEKMLKHLISEIPFYDLVDVSLINRGGGGGASAPTPLTTPPPTTPPPQDTTPPRVGNISAPDVELGQNAIVEADVFDLNTITRVLAELDVAWNYTMNKISGNRYRTKIQYPELGLHNLRFYAKDSGNNVNSSVTKDFNVYDTIPPAWIEMPEDQIVEFGWPFTYDVNASDLQAVTYSIDDIINFKINSNTGLIKNATKLGIGDYALQINATDPSYNVLGGHSTVRVRDTIPPSILDKNISLVKNETIGRNLLLYELSLSEPAALTIFNNVTGTIFVNSRDYLASRVGNFTLEEGHNELYADLVDNFNNKNKSIFLEEFDIDITQIPACLDIDPDTLNLKSKGKWVVGYIELPTSYDPSQIDVNSGVLWYGNMSVPAANDKKHRLSDKKCEKGALERILKFNRRAVQDMFAEAVDAAVLKLTGKVFYNDSYVDFEGSDTIKVIKKGKPKKEKKRKNRIKINDLENQ